MESNDIELGVKIYKEVLSALKKHCEEIEECIRIDIEEEISKNGT